MDYLMLVDKFNPIDMGFCDRVELTEVNGKFMESQAGSRLRILLKKAEADGIKLKIISASVTKLRAIVKRKYFTVSGRSICL